MASKTFAAVGAAESFVVPTGVTFIDVDCYGAQGGGNAFRNYGGRTQGRITVTPGETLTIFVGGDTTLNGFNGGGRVGATSLYAGGATDVRRGGTALANRVIVAAGGGSDSTAGLAGGGGGGLTGTAGANNAAKADQGTGGSQTAGGTRNGALGVGGNSGAAASPGGAGGGGYYGGGAGASYDAGTPGAGGGGGSALVPSGGSTTAGVRVGHGTLTLTYNHPPDAPTLTTMTSNGTVAGSDLNRAQHVHSDPDGDGQAAFELRYRVVGAMTWTVVSQTTVNNFYDFPAGTLANGDYERQVRTSDDKLFGPWSASGFFKVAARPAGPTFVSPISGETISNPTFNAEVSATTFDTLELRVLDAAGAVIVPVVSSSNGLFTGVGPVANSQTVTLQARAVKDTLAGDWTSISNPVSYTLPPKATGSLTEYLAAGLPVGISVRISVPAPATGEPSVQSVAVERSEFIAGAWSAFRVLRAARALSPNATYHDLTVASGLETRYRIRADATNGTSSFSDIVVALGGTTDTSGTDPVETNVSTTV